ncbi:MAG: D-alanine--D-alanine ligase A [Candidatus Aminicenantes bacterium RBG_13_62_12]|nr:MAG: D-alanine--D-alanine ligase A [Candidatus Aminicenantes bacterium RBG_13_62_12]
MKRSKIKIALLFGGRSAEHEVSLASASAIYKNLDKSRYAVTSIFIDKTGRWRRVSSPLQPLKKLQGGPAFSFLPWESPASQSRRVRADIYFPVLHGPYGEDGTVQGLLELADVPYVGAGVLSSAVGMDKAVMKVLFADRKLPIVRHQVIEEGEWKKSRGTVSGLIRREFALPVFVKPANLGSSVGISKVKKWEEAGRALARAFRYDRKVVVEEGIKGREIECSVLGNDEPRASLPGEVIPYRDFYDYRDKYLEGKTRFRIPADLPAGVIREVQRLAVEAYRAVECSGLARLDFFLEDGTGKIYVNEINTIPGFTEISMYPKLWGVSGIPFGRLVEELIRLGLQRHRRKKRCLERLAL